MKRRTFVNNAALTTLSFMLANKTKAFDVKKAPLKIAVIGLVHAHVGWILNNKNTDDVEIIAIVEPNLELAKKYSKQYGYSLDLVFKSLEEMYTKVKPQAVTVFTNIYDHLKVVQFCAPKGIHVMVEKPLAVNVTHAKEMEQLAKKHKIVLLTNFETTWYSSNKKARQYIIDESKAGEIRKIIFHTGHEGPFEIGCGKEFTDWLTDPVLNGGGALTDFGCYGANLATWFMKGQKPISVSCTTKQIKPNKYPKVEDDCIIVLNYAKSNVIIEASWNWPFSIKDMQIFGQNGYVHCHDSSNLSYRWQNDKNAIKENIPDNPSPLNDPFLYLSTVINKEITPQPFDLSSLENNLIVIEILDAAKKSAKSGELVYL